MPDPVPIWDSGILWNRLSGCSSHVTDLDGFFRAVTNPVDPIPANGFLELLVSVINCRDRRPMPQPSSLGESTGSSATVWTTQTQRYLEVRDLHTLD